MKQIARLLTITAIMIGIGSAVVPATTANAINVFDQCASNADAAVCKAQGDSASGLITNVINTLLTIIGMVSVVMIVIGGIKYTTSNGDAGSIKSAKETILYSVIGLVVAMMSFVIVNFVISNFR